jgi:GT2 family glycosyltransferase
VNTGNCVNAFSERIGNGREMFDVYFVVVLYNCKITESAACRSLLSMHMPNGVRLRGLIYDNTPNITAENKNISDRVEYCSTGVNNGLPAAYNDGIRRGAECGAQYIMLVDQDSTITTEFLEAAAQAAKHPSAEQVVWVPHIIASNRHISPYKFNAFGLPTFAYDLSRTPAAYFAINSYSIISLRFLRQIGGFDEFYWLDGLDSWFFSRVARMGHKVGVIGVDVTHHLSLLDRSVSAPRLLNIARYESCFLWECLPKWQAVTGTVRVFARGVLNVQLLLHAGQMLGYLREMSVGVRAGLSRRHDS